MPEDQGTALEMENADLRRQLQEARQAEMRWHSLGELGPADIEELRAGPTFATRNAG